MLLILTLHGPLIEYIILINENSNFLIMELMEWI